MNSAIFKANLEKPKITHSFNNVKIGDRLIVEDIFGKHETRPAVVVFVAQNGCAVEYLSTKGSSTHGNNVKPFFDEKSKRNVVKSQSYFIDFSMIIENQKQSLLKHD